MDPEQLVILFDYENEMLVTGVQEYLLEQGIPSVHISSEEKPPRPRGLRIMYKDLERAKKILEEFNIEAYREIVETTYKSNPYTILIIIAVIVVIGLILFFLNSFLLIS
ncbi:MAG: hypothetical protein C0596_10870 [Marinilabiliales bacterium]|nr:MAG: hypothetical protein C0596_10870 [Marinilabiliales bacterium]